MIQIKYRYFIVLVTCIFLCACNPNSQRSGFKKPIQSFIPKDTIIDTSLIAIIPFAQGSWVFDTTYRSTKLSTSDLKEIEVLLIQCINDYNNKLSSDDKANWYISTGYYRQYIAALNKNEEKIVWINCFCRVYKDWKKSIVFVEDGGSCYFNLKVNLTTKKYYDLGINGIA